MKKNLIHLFTFAIAMLISFSGANNSLFESANAKDLEIKSSISSMEVENSIIIYFSESGFSVISMYSISKDNNVWVVDVTDGYEEIVFELNIEELGILGNSNETGQGIN